MQEKENAGKRDKIILIKEVIMERIDIDDKIL